MNRIKVTLLGTTPLHLHYRDALQAYPFDHCVFRNGRPTVGRCDISATIEEAAYQVGGGELRLLTAIFTKICEPRIAIAYHGLAVVEMDLASNRHGQPLYVGLSFARWQLTFTLEVPGETGEGTRELFEIAGTDIGLGHQLSGLNLGRFIIHRWNPLPDAVKCGQNSAQCSR